jgi:hypothetical protein
MIIWLRFKNILRYMMFIYNVDSPNIFGVKHLTEGTNLTNSHINKGLKWNFFSLRDQYETKNIFKGPID